MNESIPFERAALTDDAVDHLIILAEASLADKPKDLDTVKTQLVQAKTELSTVQAALVKDPTGETAAKPAEDAQQTIGGAVKDLSDAAPSTITGQITVRALGSAADLVKAVEVLKTQPHLSGRQSFRRSAAFALIGWGIIFAVRLIDWRFGLAPDDGSLSGNEIDAATIAGAIMVFGLSLLFWIGGGSFRRYLVGKDRRWSTSKVQVAFWTVIVVSMVTYLSFLALLRGGTDITNAVESLGLTGDRVDEYLILLGGPFAAAVIAKFATTSKVENGTIQKPSAALPAVAQVGQGDSGSADLVDAQYLLFNLVAMGYVVFAFVAEGVLPEIPTVLLALTGASAATYAANKALQRNPPSIVSVTPLTIRGGEKVTVTGTNFTPDEGTGAAATIPGISISGVAGELAPLSYSDASIDFQSPIGLASGTQTVTVRSTANVTTEGYQITVINDDPLLIGATSTDLKYGESITLIGQYLLPADPRAAQLPIAVYFGDEWQATEAVKTSDDGRQQVTFKVTAPQPPAEGTLPKSISPLVSIKRGTHLSNSVKMTIRDPNPE